MWYQKPGRVILAIVGVLVAIGGVLFGAQVVHYMRLIQSGELDPKTGVRKDALKASISSQFANTHVTSEDLERLIPKTAVPTLGAADAPLTIVEFVDYGCPYCKSASSVIRNFMTTHAADTRLIIRDFPITELHPSAENAALAAHCVFRTAPQRYWLFHDRLFANQSAQSLEDLRGYAQQLGINMTSYDTCMRVQAPMAEITQSINDGLAVGVQGTPTFFFNGVKISGALTAEQLELIAQEGLAASSKR